MGGKSKLLWLIHKLAPPHYDRFLDVFGGSGTVTLSRPVSNCMEVYNDANGDLVNLFRCVRDRPMALLLELGFLPLNSREEFEVLCRQFRQEEFTDSYMEEELRLAEIFLSPPEAEVIQGLMKDRAERMDVRRAADYYKLIRHSFSGGTKSFAGRPCDIRRFFYQIWQCSRRLADVVIENKDFADLIAQYDREGAFIYCDPPYYEAEDCYDAVFGEADHQRLHDVLMKCAGFVMVSYNHCDYICQLYKEVYIFRTSRPNSMSQKTESVYEEVVITNYDPRSMGSQMSLFQSGSSSAEEGSYELIHEPAEHELADLPQGFREVLMDEGICLESLEAHLNKGDVIYSEGRKT